MSANYVTVRYAVLVEFAQVFCILPQNRINDISHARFLMIKFPATSVRVCTLARCKKVLLAGFGKSEWAGLLFSRVSPKHKQNVLLQWCPCSWPSRATSPSVSALCTGTTRPCRCGSASPTSLWRWVQWRTSNVEICAAEFLVACLQRTRH